MLHFSVKKKQEVQIQLQVTFSGLENPIEFNNFGVSFFI